ncbi:unnamed protein product [Euphydryas editha]|uniref:Uncharacterized protein n=1 Tax=Euphydryas editha TaxID=104508 RepID=A0AAU9UZZ4_EUPED|nr:unnamed protein product [Euphydryas editha]
MVRPTDGATKPLPGHPEVIKDIKTLEEINRKRLFRTLTKCIIGILHKGKRSMSEMGSASALDEDGKFSVDTVLS